MKCKKCGSNIIDIVDEEVRAIITPIGLNAQPLGRVFSARCPKCQAESSRYLPEEEAETEGVKEVFQ